MPTFGVSRLILIPVRKEPAERSEMVSQLLFGETVEIIKHKGSWSLIHSNDDNYNGWITKMMLTILNENEFKSYQSAIKIYLKEPVCRVSLTEAKLPVSYLAGGSTLLEEHSKMLKGNYIVGLDENTELHRLGSKVDIVGIALKFLNTPYLWGGRTIFGIDCSGLTQIVFKMNGLMLPRDASQQAEAGNLIANVEEAKPGDLAFFEDEKGSITHTGIILKNSEIIHSCGKVHVDKIDNHGIFNIEAKEYSHKLTKIKRMI